MNLGIKDIKIVENESFILSLFDIFSLIFPGVSILYAFNSQLFLSLDWVKIILLSGAITTPLALINTFVMYLFLLPRLSSQGSNNNLFISSFVGILAGGLVLYAVIAMHFLFGRSFKEGVYFTIIIELILIFLAYIRVRKIKRKSK